MPGLHHGPISCCVSRLPSCWSAASERDSERLARGASILQKTPFCALKESQTINNNWPNVQNENERMERGGEKKETGLTFRKQLLLYRCQVQQRTWPVYKTQFTAQRTRAGHGQLESLYTFSLWIIIVLTLLFHLPEHKYEVTLSSPLEHNWPGTCWALQTITHNWKHKMLPGPADCTCHARNICVEVSDMFTGSVVWEWKHTYLT